MSEESEANAKAYDLADRLLRMSAEELLCRMSELSRVSPDSHRIMRTLVMAWLFRVAKDLEMALPSSYLSKDFLGSTFPDLKSPIMDFFDFEGDKP